MPWFQLIREYNGELVWDYEYCQWGCPVIIVAVADHWENLDNYIKGLYWMLCIEC